MMVKMTDRTAINTIKGYFYQFDYTILKLLELSLDTEHIFIERIEDIDIKTATEETAIQCKYYENTEYNHSVIAKPIRLMLDHFKEVKHGTKQNVIYCLYGYFKSGQDKLLEPINIDFLKEKFLTYSEKKVIHQHHIKHGLSDEDLAGFLSKLTININAEEYHVQLEKIFKLLMAQFSCSKFQAEAFFYNNAIKFIKNVSVQADVANRKITKKDFLNGIDNKKILFNEWYIQIKGEKAHFNSLRNEYFCDINVLYRERFFLFEIDSNNYSRQEVRDLLVLLINKYTKIAKQPTPFCPYVYFQDIPDLELIELKKDLIDNDILVIDGFDFEGAEFNHNSLHQKPSSAHPIKIKFLNKLDYLNKLLLLTGRKAEIYQFYFRNEVFTNENTSIKEVKIQIKNLNHVKNII